MKPEISLVIPLYNKEKYIRRTIESVLHQTVQNFECIIIDSSTDGSRKLVSQYQDPRIFLESFEKLTAAQARNRGARIARSDLIAFLDADDEWMPDHLESLLHIRNKFPGAGLYSTPYVKIKPDGRPMVMLFYAIPPPPWEGLIPEYLLTCSRGDEPVNSSSCAVPRDIFTAMGGFPEDYVYGEDQYLWGKISLAYPVAYCWKGLAIYHTEALGRICDEAHGIPEHPFSAYLRHELAAGTIPDGKRQECYDYIRRKRVSVFFSMLINRGRTPSGTGTPVTATDAPAGSGKGGNMCAKVISGSLTRFYHSSVHDTLRRLLCRVCGCYDPGQRLQK